MEAWGYPCLPTVPHLLCVSTDVLRSWALGSCCSVAVEMVHSCGIEKGCSESWYHHWASPTLAWLHCAVCVYVCLLACLDLAVAVNFESANFTCMCTIMIYESSWPQEKDLADRMKLTPFTESRHKPSLVIMFCNCQIIYQSFPRGFSAWSTTVM